MANNPCWVDTSITRQRDYMVARGLAMPIDSHYGLVGFRNIAVFRLVNGGISVPISRGSPPILNDR